MEGERDHRRGRGPGISLLLLCGAICVAIGATWVGLSAPASAGSGYTLTEDIPYARIDGVDPSLTSLDVYRPQGGTGLPVLIFIHGGAWFIGDKKHHGEIGRTFSQAGYVTVTINYRLSPAVIHPAHVTDVAAAVAWVVKNIAGYGGDPTRVFVAGHSAGGHLAALVATDERYLAQHGLSLGVLAGVIPLDGAGFDIPELMAQSERAYGRMYRRAFGDDPKNWADGSPINHVAAGKGIPPFLVIWAGSRDDARLQAQHFAEALAAAGVPVETYHAQDKNHRSVLADIGRPGEEVTRVILEFLKKQGG